MAENIFNLINILPLPIWISMMLFPKARFTQRMVLSNWPYIMLGGLYLLLLLAAITTGGAGFDISLNALRQGISSEWGFVAGWAHYIVFDLFVGVWIFRDAKYYGINPTIYLIFTLLAGPIGLAAYLVMKQRNKSKEPIRVVN